MKRRLRLFRLLKWYKELLEEQSKLRVYEASVNLQKLFAEKELLEEEFNDCQKYIEAKKIFTAEELNQWINYFERLLEFRQIVDNKIRAQEEILEKLKEELKERHQERRLTERMLNKSLLQFNAERFKKELRELDDLILLRRGRGLE